MQSLKHTAAIAFATAAIVALVGCSSPQSQPVAAAKEGQSVEAPVAAAPAPTLDAVDEGVATPAEVQPGDPEFVEDTSVEVTLIPDDK